LPRDIVMSLRGNVTLLQCAVTLHRGHGTSPRGILAEPRCIATLHWGIEALPRSIATLTACNETPNASNGPLHRCNGPLIRYHEPRSRGEIPEEAGPTKHDPSSEVKIRDVAPGLWLRRTGHPGWRPNQGWAPLVAATCVESGGRFCSSIRSAPQAVSMRA